MTCPHCHTTDNNEAIGYSIFDIVFSCKNCDGEFDIKRNQETEHYVQDLKAEEC